MYPKNRKISLSPHIIKVVILICAALASWVPILKTKFLNDDIQIIGTAIPAGFKEIFTPFYSMNVWGFYFRPLLESIFKLILFISGLQPGLFHIVTLALYIGAVVLAYQTGKKLGFSEKAAFIGALLFAVFPGHDINAGWISATSDLLACNFLLATTMLMARYFNMERLRISSVFLLAALILLSLISKEVTYMGFLLPLMFLFNVEAPDKAKRNRAFTFSSMYIGIQVLLITYRYMVVKSNLLSSTNIAHVTVPQLIINFFLYIPAAILSPDNLEQLYFLLKNTYAAMILLGVLSVITFLVVKTAKSLSKSEKKLIIKSVIWFIACIIPVLPVFMRWYCFTASVGISWIAGLFFVKVYEAASPLLKKVYIIFFIAMMAHLINDNLHTSFKWVDAGNRYESYVTSIQESGIKGDTLYAWGVPDKYERIALMKLGIQETFAYALNKKTMNVDSPLHAEINNSSSTMEVIPTSNVSFKMVLHGGRFLFYGSRSRSVLVNEQLNNETPLYNIKITTTVKNNAAESIADVFVKDIAVLQKSVFFTDNGVVTFYR